MSSPLFDRPSSAPPGSASESATPPSDAPRDERVLRVSELNRAVRLSLESGWSDVWVEGELSDVTRAGSGHVYFTLNDGKEAAQVRAVMFRGDARRARAKFQDGECVRVRGSLSLYEPRGSFQLIARIAIPAGKGDLHAEFKRVREKLVQEGLMDPARKRALPVLPRTVGVVTSISGAALHDVIRVAKGRCPVRIVVAPCVVQGSDAPRSIAAALRAIQRLPDLDVVIVGRGGGSAEDLFAFNDEGVARAIAVCRVPIVSAVGHEVDVTIADLVADLRAATPSNAAELVVPDLRALAADLDSHRRGLERVLEVRFGRARLRLDRLARRLQEPRKALSGTRSRLESLNARLVRVWHRAEVERRSALSAVTHQLGRLDPRARLARDRHRLDDLTAELRNLARRLVERRRASFERCLAHLQAISPLSILSRGYSIALLERTGKALVRAKDAQPGDRVALRLHQGTLTALIEPEIPATLRLPSDKPDGG